MTFNYTLDLKRNLEQRLGKKLLKFFYYASIVLYLFSPCIYLLATREINPSLFVRFSPDDAFYYLQIGYNLANHGIVSFDGVNITTGFHPLQLLFVTAVELIFDKNNTLIFLYCFNFFAIGFSLFTISSALKINKNIIVYYSIITLPIFNLFLITNSGMESAILLILLSIFYYSLINFDNYSKFKMAIFFGIELGLIFLARLDMIIPMSIFYLFISYKYLKCQKYKLIFITIITCLLVISPYFLWMIDTQGSVFPISSIVKQYLVKASFDAKIVAMTGGQSIGLLFLATPVLVSLLSIYCYVRNLSNKQLKVAAIGSASNILYLIYIFALAHEPYRWYLNYCLFISSISLMIIFDFYFSNTSKIPKYLIILLPSICLLVNIFSVVYWSKLETISYQMLQMTYKVNKIVPINSNIAISDAGVVGYFSTSNVHNLDGLVNSYENWNNFLKHQEILDYAKKYHIKYLLLKSPSLAKINSQELNEKLVIVDSYKIDKLGDEKLIFVNF